MLSSSTVLRCISFSVKPCVSCGGGSSYSISNIEELGVKLFYSYVSSAGTRINRGRRGIAISGIWPSRSRYREDDRDNRNPRKIFKNSTLAFLAVFP